MTRYIRLLLATLVLGTVAMAQRAADTNHEGRQVEVSGRKMFLNCSGNEPGSTVILEAGSGDSSEVWSAVQEQVGEFAHVCSYDRLGLGKSDKLGVPRTADGIVDDLHQLLQAATISPPYVMVGHSIGGFMYANTPHSTRAT